ncbi:SPAG8 protein, partial [Piaya cayana]|nr:SPAG8 protein [Piaya cayana]
PSQPLRRGRCLIHNWQEERATNDLDYVPGHQLGYKSYTWQHGHHRLLTHEFPSSSPISTTMDAYRPLQMDVLPGQGEAELPLELCALQKGSEKEILEAKSPKPMPMESVSTTHQDYCTRDQQLTPLSTIQRHIYYNEQPSSFWMDQARSLPDVTSIRRGKSPARRNAAFSTPITEYLGLSPPSAPTSSQFQPHKQ